MVWVMEVHEGPTLDDTKFAKATIVTPGTFGLQMVDKEIKRYSLNSATGTRAVYAEAVMVANPGFG